ncbi:MAG: SDR family oxidoreductase [Hydrogenibacillus schlegelii]|nr:SDR family oxidoreductase [Hydrogenibacillus schlegelii]
MPRLKEKRAIITGAARGIGAGIAEAFGQEGASLVLFDKREDLLRETAERLKRLGYAVEAFPCDVADPEAVERAVAAAAQGGRIDVLVNNAAVIPRVRPFYEIRPEEWTQVLTVNLLGSFWMSRAVFPHMQRQGGGRIIMIASRTYFYAPPGQADYVASKGALMGLARVMARELGPYNITVNCIAPGFLPTPGVLENMPDAGERRHDLLKNQALQRPQEIGDFADAVVFLASDDARFITGQTLIVDGGMYFH